MVSSPLISMLAHLRNSYSTATKPRITFLYTTKSPSTSSSQSNSILFLSRLQQIEASFAGNMNLQLFITGDESGHKEMKLPRTFHRRIEDDDLLAAVGGKTDGTVCFVCGPPVMTDKFVAFLGTLVGQEMVFCEKWW
jgi:NAD(P)H-flavin reductase